MDDMGYAPAVNFAPDVGTRIVAPEGSVGRVSRLEMERQELNAGDIAAANSIYDLYTDATLSL